MAKETLLAFALTYADNFTGSPPGRFPCPDSDNDADGLPNSPCNVGNNPGRLPRRVTTGSGASFIVSDYGLQNGQRFWYAVTPAFRQSSTAVLNSNTTGTLTLDGQNDVVAIVAAPGEPLTGQTRHNNTATNYLESTNAAGLNFVSSLPANPTAFNDRVLPIYRHEVMTLVTARIVQIIRGILDTYHPANGNSYPIDEPTFKAALLAGGPPAWLAANDWDDISSYLLTSPDEVTITFGGCDVNYAIAFGQPDIERSQSSCEDLP